MKWKNRLTNYNFWISIVSAVLLILQAFNFEFDIAYISEIATAVLGLLVVIGIISDPTKSYTPTETNKETTKTTNTEELETATLPEAKPENENTSTITNVESEVDNDGFESNFQTVIDILSNEINKTINGILKTNEVPNLNTTEQNQNEQNTSTEEDFSCNIVN